MNLLDFAVTPLWLVWETVRDVAAEDGVELGRVGAHRARAAGRVPRRRRPRRRAARGRRSSDRLAAAAAFLRLRDFSPMQALELRLEAARAGRPAERRHR